MKKNKLKLAVPYFIEGSTAVDKKGEVRFVNDFDFSKIKRFYVVTVKKARVVRAWHGHKYEIKYAFVISGSALIGAMYIDDWKKPSKKTEAYRFFLSSRKPGILYIPGGYANGFMALAEDTKIIFFSTKTLDQSKKDDIRFNAKYWNIWDVSKR